MRDGAEFEEIVREHQGMVFATLARLVGCREHLEDLAQEVFLRLYRGMEGFRGDARITTYLYRIIVNVAQDEWARRRREQGQVAFDDPEAGWEDRLPGRALDAEQILSRRQVQEQLETALGELSDNERAVIVLFHQEECTYEQIALVLGLPIGTVRTHLHRGRQRLRARLAERMAVCTKTT